MSFDALQERLTALQETTTSQLRILIERLSHAYLPAGEETAGIDSDGDFSEELSAEIIQILREEEDELELLQEEVEDLPSGRPGSDAEHHKARFKESIARHVAEVKDCKVAFRKAQLTARQNLARAQRLEREQLIRAYAEPTSEGISPTTGAGDSGYGAGESPVTISHPPRHLQRQHQQHSSLSEEDQAQVGASGDVTAALRRTYELISGEVAKSEFAHQMLSESTAALEQLGESYASLDTMLASSRDLLGTLLRSQKSDTWYLQTSFYMLLATGAWLVYRRILYYFVWLAVFLPFRALSSGVGGVGRAVGVFEAGDGAALRGDGAAERMGRPTAVMDSDGVPTARAGQTGGQSVGAGDPDSMIEKVGRIIEENLGGQDVPSVEQEGELSEDERNPMKRMWEEPAHGEDEVPRVRDEL